MFRFRSRAFLLVPVFALLGLGITLGLFACGGGGDSGSGQADTTPPSVPATLVASATGATAVNLSWTASTDNVGVTGYLVKRNGTQVATPSSTSYADPGLSSGTTYTYTVAARDAAGNVSTDSASASATTIDTIAPSAPAGLVATAGGSAAIDLTWTASTDNVGVTGYIVKRDGVEVGTSASATYADRGLSSVTTYKYTVAAHDAAGNVSLESAIASATTGSAVDATLPSTPNDLVATAAGATAVNLSWTAATDNVAVTGYIVKRDGAQAGTPATTTFADTGLSSGLTYSYTVAAFDAAGNVSLDSASVNATTAVAPFSVAVSISKRYLQDQNGASFPILGRTAWFITSLSEADYRMFIDDTVAKGFNAIEFHVVNHDPRGNNEPFGGNGALPFTQQLNGLAWNGLLSYGNIINDAPDFSQPNEPFWTHVDALLAYAESKGVLCFLFPAYTGWQGQEQGWMREMVANGPARMQAYGAFIANRYKTRGNIVWMLGGDYHTNFPAPELAVEQAMLAGMQSVGGQSSTQFSAEWSGNSIYTDQADPTLRAAGTLQGAYSWEAPTSYVRNGYNHSPVMPTFLLEEPYDEEGPDGNHVNDTYATQPVRRYQWWGWLSGIGGYIAGNGYIWPFNDGWKLHLNTQGAQDMARLNAFVRSVAWHNLIPSDMSGMGTLVLGNSSPSSSSYVAAAATPDGTLLVAYVPPDHSGSITIDMTRMSGPAQARWFNPASAAYKLIGTFDNTGTPSFTPPGDNGTGFNDWVLLLEKQ